MESKKFQINFWGVRGSIPCPGPETVRYGGNTPCIEMEVGGERLIFDGGTGLRLLGRSLLEQMPVQAHLFFTHSHWDHIQGFPFFTPAFIKGNSFKIYGAVAPDGSTIKQRLTNQMLHPNFPVPLQIMQSELDFYDLEVGENLQIGSISVQNAPLNHPGEAIGYRVSWRGYTAAYITDTEPFTSGLGENVFRLALDADVAIIDCTYTDEEYHNSQNSKVGWGHSTWQEAVKLAKAARVGRLVVFHHDPLHNDEFLDRVGAEAAAALPGTIMAQEGKSLDVMAIKEGSSQVIGNRGELSLFHNQI